MLIDFGLAYTTSLPEDKAVDLYVLERAITSAHSSLATLVRVWLPRVRVYTLHENIDITCSCPQFEHIVEEYKRVSNSWKPTLTKFAEGE